MAIKIIHYGRVEGGVLKLNNPTGFKMDVKAMDGIEIEMSISKKKKTRSTKQNAYYWSTVIPVIKQGLIDAGFNRSIVNDSNLVHEFLKNMFCPKIELVNEDTGEVLTLPPTTTSNTTTQMMEYFQEIQIWAAEKLGISVPDPGEVMMLNFD